MEMIKELITSIYSVVKEWVIGEWLAHGFGIELY